MRRKMGNVTDRYNLQTIVYNDTLTKVLDFTFSPWAYIQMVFSTDQ